MSTIERQARQSVDDKFDYEYELPPGDPDPDTPAKRRFACGTLKMAKQELDPTSAETDRFTALVERDEHESRAAHVVSVQDVASIAHDFKNPLSTILLEVTSIQESLTEEGGFDVRRSLARVERNIACIDHMVHDLLDLASIDARQLRIRRQRLDLAVLLVELVERVISTRDRHRVYLDVSASLTLLADGPRIERVVANLIENAFKYAPRGSPVTVRLDDLGDYARVSVIDAGPGLTPEEARCVFDKFRRTRAADIAEGSGLGLYVSSKIIESHGGRIGVASGIGKGSGFFFELPIGPDRSVRTP